MAYLKAREHDVFVSYAHVDNIPDRDGDKGWVEQFEKQLEVRLLKRFGEPVDVWRDPELSRSQLFDQVIEKAVRGSGVMVSLVSSRYLKSDYCGQEVEWFRQQTEGDGVGLVVGDYLRVFPVLLYNIGPGEWPAACKGCSAFKFHDAEGDEFGEPLDPAGEPFQKQLRRLVEEIHAVLTLLRERQTPEPAPGPAVEGSFTVFLSQPPDDLRPTGRQLAAALGREGFKVIAGLPPPYEGEAHAAAVKGAIESADLAVHLLSTLPGEPLEEGQPGGTYPLAQARIGLEHARSQLILMPEELDLELVDEPSYAEFLRELGERQRDAGRLELVRTGRHQMLDEILAKRRKLEEAARQTAQAACSPGSAFIDLHTRDVPYATDLVGFLAGKRVTPVMIPSAELSPTAGMSLFEDNLRRAQLFIVVFGTVARAWVEHRLQEAFKLILSHQLETRIGIYVAPPEKPADQVRFPGLFKVAVNMSRFDPGTLESLLS